ncbi:MAG: hypothetical protein ACERJ2_12780 [Filomicrobium sp.]
MKRFILLAIASSLSVLTMIGPTRADISDVEILFVRTDEDGNLTLSKAEVLKMAIVQFNLVDSNKSGAVEPAEAGELASDVEFTDNDTDRSGSLSLEEVISEKLADYDRADLNSDGRLSLDEVKQSYKKSQDTP